MKKRLRRTSSSTPTPATPVAAPPEQVPLLLQYKVVELSTVDEGTIGQSVNEWTRQGWNLDGVQFAMRESSKRPAMAFLFFTRQAARTDHDTGRARARLIQMSAEPVVGKPPSTGLRRLRELAEDDVDSGGE